MAVQARGRPGQPVTRHAYAAARDPEWAQVGRRLRLAREYRSLSQQQVADTIGTGRVAVSDMERGARRVDALELRALARLYQRPIAYFLGEQTQAAADGAVTTEVAGLLLQLSDTDRDTVLAFARFLRSEADARPDGERVHSDRPGQGQS